MPAGEYRVERMELESYDNVEEALEQAITAGAQDGWELVSCVPHPPHSDLGIHEASRTDTSEDPYDAVWQAPMGPTFYAVFRRSPKA